MASLPDLESLRCFEAGATHLNFRVAAKAVGLSPTAFSDRIKRLEDQLTAKLFERTTRKVWLSAAGQRLLPQARSVLKQARACEEVVQDERAASVRLKVGTRFELGLSWIVPQLKGLKARRPERSIDVHFGNGPDLLSMVTHGAIDAVVSSIRLTEPDLRYARLHEEAYVLVASPTTVKTAPLSSAEHAPRHTLLDTNQSLPLFRYFLDAASAEDVWSFERYELLGTIAALRHRLLEDAGIAVLPRYFVGEDLAAGRLVQLMPEVQMRSDWFRLIWRMGNPAEAELVALAEELRGVPLQ